MHIKQRNFPFKRFKFIYAFGANTTNITKVDWDEIKLTLTNWLLKTMTHYGCKFFKKKLIFHIKCHQTKSAWHGKI